MRLGQSAAQEHHGMIKLLSAPIRTIVRFPLFQLAVVVLVILYLQAGDEGSVRGQIFDGLDKLVGATVDLFSGIFSVKSFTKSWLTSGFMIAYVYLAGLLFLYLVRMAIAAVTDFAGRHNAFGLRSMIARERGISAYQAWLPFERIRPAHIPREAWEERYAWPAGDRPPYRPLAQRILLGIAGYVVLLLIIAALLQIFAPSALAWLVHLADGVHSMPEMA
jgi:hypothetical protein